MLLHIPGILDPSRVIQFQRHLADARWVDGRVTAGYRSAAAKHNRQLREDDPLALELGAQITDAVLANPTFFAAALPRHVYPPLFNCYADGDHFGLHVDNAIRYDRRQANAQPVRTDLSCTLFLSAPESYDGGELVIEDTFGSHAVKLPAGDLVLYPAGSLHRVEPVTRGARIAAFFWLQSLIREDERRRLLFELDLAIQRLTASGADAESLLALTGVYHNLLRQWSAP